MLKDITIGQYFPGNSPVHRLDPRVKILLTGLYIAAVFLARSVWGYLAVLLFVALTAKLAAIPMKYLARGLKPILLLVAFTFVFNVLMGPEGRELYRWKFLRITAEGLVQALQLMARLILLVLGTSLLTLCTSPIALTDGLERLFAPLKRLRFPVHELAMMMTIALRFIPTLLSEADRIMKAQMARGADFESGNLLSRARAMVPLLVPLFVSAIRRADELAVAMEARCYHGGEGRTRMRVLRLTAADGAAGAALCALVALAALL